MAGTVLEDITSETIDSYYIERRVEDWKKRVISLYQIISDWLPDGWQARAGSPVTMHEPLMQTHGVEAEQIPTLILSSQSGDRVKLEPEGLWIIPINGRIVVSNSDDMYFITDYADNFEQPDWQAARVKSRLDREKVSREWLNRILQ